jgi:hypothetical protein
MGHRLCAPVGTRLTSTNHPASTKGGTPGALGAGAHPGTPGLTAPAQQTDTTPETGRHNQ